jgi:protein required for attachment to host cells
MNLMKHSRTWILVADGGKARIFEFLGVGKGVHQLPGLEETLALPANRQLQHDRPGRGFESASPSRHAYDAGDPHRLMKWTFARHLADELAAAHVRGAFNRLVLVAPSEMLGNLRSAIDGALAAAVVGELAQDLTHLPTAEIGDQLAAILPV